MVECASRLFQEAVALGAAWLSSRYACGRFGFPSRNTPRFARTFARTAVTQSARTRTTVETSTLEQNSGVSKRRRDGEEDDEECGPGEHDGLEDEEEDGDEEEEDRDRSDDRLDAYIIEERMAKEEAETVEAVIDQYMERSKTEYVLVSLGGSVAGEVRGRECEDG